MPVEVTTQDCSSLSDNEIAEMADLSALSSGFDVGDLSKQLEEWVLVSRAYRKGELGGFILSTLERIGGTPALIVGVGQIAEGSQKAAVCKALVHQQYYKALMAFPDEDVVVAARILEPGGYVLHNELSDIRPWPEVRPNGEDRAWGRRLAKKYQADSFDDRTMIARCQTSPMTFACDFQGGEETTPVFENCSVADGDYVLAWGWAMAEYLERFSSPG